MRRTWPSICWAIFVLSLCVCGCQAPTEEMVDSHTPSARRVAEGSVDEKLVASWHMKTVGNESTMDISKDGSYTIKSKVQSQGGPQDSEVAGKWSVKDKELLMERNGPDGKPFTVVYQFNLRGSDLELSTKESKIKYKYTRQ